MNVSHPGLHPWSPEQRKRYLHLRTRVLTIMHWRGETLTSTQHETHERVAAAVHFSFLLSFSFLLFSLFLFTYFSSLVFFSSSPYYCHYRSSFSSSYYSSLSLSSSGHLPSMIASLSSCTPLLLLYAQSTGAAAC